MTAILALLRLVPWRVWFRIVLAALVATALVWAALKIQHAAVLAAQVKGLKADLEFVEQRDRIRKALNDAETARLAAEQTDRLTFGRLTDEAAADPTAAAPSLGLRSIDRLNAIR